MAIKGSRNNTSPNVVGIDGNNTPRKVDASEERISCSLTSANWAEKVGRAAVAID